MDLNASDLVLGLVGLGDDGLGEAELGGFLEAFLAALQRADFACEADLAEFTRANSLRLAKDVYGNLVIWPTPASIYRWRRNAGPRSRSTTPASTGR